MEVERSWRWRDGKSAVPQIRCWPAVRPSSPEPGKPPPCSAWHSVWNRWNRYAGEIFRYRHGNERLAPSPSPGPSRRRAPTQPGSTVPDFLRSHACMCFSILPLDAFLHTSKEGKCSSRSLTLVHVPTSIRRFRTVVLAALNSACKSLMLNKIQDVSRVTVGCAPCHGPTPAGGRH